MATTRKRARTDDGKFQGDNPETTDVNEAWVTAETLSEFIGFNGDKAKLNQAIKLSTEAAENFIGRPVPGQMGHNLAQGIKLLATKLLITDKLEEAPEDKDIPLTVRYYFKLAADAQG